MREKYKRFGIVFFTLYLFAGYFKGDPSLAILQNHIDITVLLFAFSFSIFVFRVPELKIARDFFWMIMFYLLLAAILVGGLLYTQNIQYGTDKTLRFIVLTGWAFLGSAMLAQDYSSLRLFCWMLTIISTIMAFGAVINHTGNEFTTVFGSNYIALARACGLGFLTVVGFLLPTEKELRIKLGLWFVAALLLWATLVAGARGPVTALSISLILFFILSLRLRDFPILKIDRFAWYLGIVIFFTVIIISAFAPELFPTLASRIQILVTTVGVSAATRLEFYKAAFDQWTDSPIIGGGTGQFGSALLGKDVDLYPHNILLELASENGLLGVLVFMIMVGFSFYKGIAELCRRFIINRYLMAALCFALLNAMVSGDINDNRIVFTFIALLSLTFLQGEYS